MRIIAIKDNTAKVVDIPSMCRGYEMLGTSHVAKRYTRFNNCDIVTLKPFVKVEGAECDALVVREYGEFENYVDLTDEQVVVVMNHFNGNE